MSWTTSASVAAMIAAEAGAEVEQITRQGIDTHAAVVAVAAETGRRADGATRGIAGGIAAAVEAGKTARGIDAVAAENAGDETAADPGTDGTAGEKLQAASTGCTVLAVGLLLLTLWLTVVLLLYHL